MVGEFGAGEVKGEGDGGGSDDEPVVVDFVDEDALGGMVLFKVFSDTGDVVSEVLLHDGPVRCVLMVKDLINHEQRGAAY